MTSLNQFVEGNFSLSASKVNGSDFASGTGSVVNNGFWGSGAHKNEKRVNNFRWILDELKQAGLATCDA